MFRIIPLHIIFILIISHSLIAKENKKQKEINAAKKLEAIADSLVEAEAFEKAIPKYQKAALAFKKNKNWSGAVSNCRKIAWCFFSTEKLDSAQYFIDYCYKLLNKKVKSLNENYKFELSEICYIQSRIFRNKGEIDSAFYHLDKGLKILNNLKIRNNSYYFLLAKYYQSFGTTNYYKGDENAALKYYFKALDIKLNNLKNGQEHSISSYYNIALVYYAKKDYEKATQYFLNIINNCTQNNRKFEAHSYNTLGVIYQKAHKFQKALDCYYKAIDIYRKEEEKNSLHIALTMNNLGKIYCSTKDYERALEKIKISISLRKKNLGEFHPILSKSLLTLGQYYYLMAEYDNAIKSFIEAIEIVDKSTPTDNILKNQLYELIGTTYLQQNKPNQALESFQNAIEILINGYEFDDKKNNLELFFRKTNIINEEIEILSKSSLFNNLVNKAKALLLFYKKNDSLINKLKKSLNTYDLAFQLLDIIRLDISTEESKYILNEEKKFYFIEAIDISLKLDSLFPDDKYNEYTLKFVNKCKSSALQDKSFIKNAFNKANIPKKIIETERDLSKKIAFYKTELNKSYERDKSQEFNNYIESYHNLSVKYDTICNYLKNTYPKYYKLIHLNEFDINTIKSSIKKDELVIEYFVANSHIFIISIDNKNHSITKIPVDSSFKQNVIKYYRSLKKIENLNYRHYNSILYQTLIKPIEDKIESKKSLIIIPDDYLFYIPFETLYDDECVSDNFDFRNFNYLIKNYDIRYHYSLNLWLFNKIIGNNKVKDIEGFIGFAPVFEDQKDLPTTNLNYSDTTTRTIVIDGKRFATLHYSEKEINEISNLFLKRNLKASTFFYNSATEDNFKENISKYKYIHLSTHGFSNKDNPNLSGLAFYKSENVCTTNNLYLEDGILYSSEIKNLDINANLVILSSCEGGMGKLVEGEGLIAITRDFISSGTPNIIYSLWNVLDKNTCELMIKFYKEILSGESYSHALRKIKIKMIKNIKTSHPKTWGSFILIGI